MRTAFLNDARAAAKLSHPNITTLFDVGEYEGGSYLAYEFASGISLRQECAGRAVNPRRAVELAVHIADALAEGHAQGLLHGDIRPETILVTHKGSAKVLEFGMASWTTGGRIRARAASSPQSLGADAVSVVSYMSPEQALGGSVDARTDIFSLGVVLYEMLAGRHPFAAADVEKTLVNVTERGSAGAGGRRRIGGAVAVGRSGHGEGDRPAPGIGAGLRVRAAPHGDGARCSRRGGTAAHRTASTRRRPRQWRNGGRSHRDCRHRRSALVDAQISFFSVIEIDVRARQDDRGPASTAVQRRR